LAGATALILVASIGQGFAQGEPEHYIGTVTYIDPGAVEVSGRRGVFTDQSVVTSDNHGVGRGSVRAGSPAELEVDSAGRVIELRVTGVVE
jgi:hypothetical protein